MESHIRLQWCFEFIFNLVRDDNRTTTFLLYNANAVVLALTHGWAPFAILPIFVSLEKIDRSLLEASTDLGDSAIDQFLNYTPTIRLMELLVQL